MGKDLGEYGGIVKKVTESLDEENGWIKRYSGSRVRVSIKNLVVVLPCPLATIQQKY